jgi:MFS family permease
LAGDPDHIDRQAQAFFDAFVSGGAMPTKYTGEGEDISPPLSWFDAPQETQSFALICHDPDAPLVAFAEWAAKIQPDTVVLAEDQGQRMARLMITIFAENIAGGFALVAMTAYLTSVVNPRFAAVQYALLASLTMLIGTLGRPWLGEMIETDGFYTVFIVTFWLGGVAVVLSVLEWLRQVYWSSPGEHLVLEDDPVAAE